MERGVGRLAVRQGHFEDAGARAECGEQLGIADDVFERLVLQLEVARRRGDDRAVGVGDEDVATVAGGVERQRPGERVERVGARHLTLGAGIGIRQDAHDHRDRLARIVLAVAAQLIELDETGEPDDQQEDCDEDRDQPAKHRFGSDKLTVGGAGKEPGMAGNSRTPRSSTDRFLIMLRRRRRCRLCPRHGRLPSISAA